MQEVGNIFGEAFAPYVKKQIQDREKVFGAGLAEGQLIHAFNSDSQTIGYLNYIHANSAYTKLVSSVDVLDTSRFKGTSLEGVVKTLDGSKFAKQLVLLGGVALPQSQSGMPYGYKDGESRVRESLPLNNADFTQDGQEATYNIFNRGNYGFGGSEFGLRPMPGITSAVIEHLNEGAFRKATVKLKAYNRAQLEMIDALYLRIGFTVLLEWGHTIIARRDENNVLEITSDLTDNYSLESTFIKGGVDFYEVADLIRANRAASQGNYDGFCGRVANYSWNFLPDGTFDISIIMYSVGDVIESLNINSKTLPGEDEDKQNTQDLSTPGARIEANATKSDIGLFLASEKRLLDQTPSGLGKTVNNKTITYRQQAGFYINSTAKKKGAKQRFNPYGTVESPFIDTCMIQWQSGHSAEYYVRFGTFLRFLEQYKILQTKGGVKVTKIDYDEDRNIIYLPDKTYTYPIDPRVCIWKDQINTDANYEFFKGLEDFKKFKKTKEQTIKNEDGTTFTKISGIDYGLLMNVYFNMDYILTVLDSNRDSKTMKVSAQRFLQQMCDDLCAVLGGINKINVTVDEEYNKIKFVDSVTYPELISTLDAFGASTDYATFNVYGFIGEGGYYKGSFVKEFSFNTQLSKDTSTLIGIGAAANSRVVGEDDTAFSKWNRGLKDRIWSDIYDPVVARDTENAENSIKKTIDTQRTQYVDFLEQYGIPDSTLKNYSWDEGGFEIQKQAQRQLIQYELTKDANEQGTAGTTIGFLPVKASITMKGLSGMKIYQIFNINADFLPANIPSTLNFLSSNIRHTIENNRWDTTLETITVPASVLEKGAKTGRRAGGAGTGGGKDSTGGKGKYITGQPVVDILVKFLQEAGIPVTEETKKFVIGWKRSESGPNAYNLFGSTQRYNGSRTSKGSSVGVQSYKTEADGIKANATTIKNGRYNGILGDLRAGKLTAIEIADKYAKTELTTWGTGPLLGRVLRGGISNLNFLKLYVL
jgi:hypothetical protein